MYDELVKALRYCADEDKICTEQTNCGYYGKGFFCQDALMRDAAGAIERLVEEIDRKDKAIQGLLNVVDKKNVKIDLWKRAWRTAYKLYEATKESKGEQDGERAEQYPEQDAE